MRQKFFNHCFHDITNLTATKFHGIKYFTLIFQQEFSRKIESSGHLLNNPQNLARVAKISSVRFYFIYIHPRIQSFACILIFDRVKNTHVQRFIPIKLNKLSVELSKIISINGFLQTLAITLKKSIKIWLHGHTVSMVSREKNTRKGPKN